MKKELQEMIEKAVKEAFGIDKAFFTVDYAKDEKFGDYSTNAAMVLGKVLKKNPMEIAEEIVDKIKCHSEPAEESNRKNKLDPSAPLRSAQDDTESIFEKIKVVAPGYINFYLSEKYLQDKVAEINEKKEKYGNSEIGRGIKINNEFISANPTGPLTVGNGRGGFCGDSLARVLKKTGFDVVNEYYVNDAGGQVEKLGHSVLKDAEAAYAGEYIDKIREIGEIREAGGIREVGKKAAEYILENIIKKSVAEKMQISFDVWMSEKYIQEEKFVDRAIEILKKKNLTYESDGALWLKTSQFGDDKDRVLIKSDGQKAYFAGDCGYILNKIERGFDKIVEIWGADHHGYVSRFRAATKMLGFSEENIKFIITQLVRLVKDGKEVRMSKRAGNVVEIDELIDEVGHDVARFFFLMYSPDTHMNFDLGLAKERSEKNPVYYVQYAYARISSILAKIQNSKIKMQNNGNLFLLTREKELSLIRELDKFPELVEEIGENYEVHKLPHYAIKLADKFHSFYNDCRVIDEENPELSGARLNLINAVRIVLAEALRLIGVSAPERM